MGIGGEPCPATSFLDVIEAFDEDDQTEAIVTIRETGGAPQASLATSRRKLPR